MSKHTPGPWIDSPYAIDAVISQHPDATAKAGDCNVYYGGFLICESTGFWNKELIKAAPDLLAACEKLLDLAVWVSGAPTFNPGGDAREGWLKICGAINEGYTAIVKAKGNQ